MAARVTAKDPSPTSERIEQLANRVLIGDIILPEFQRPFIWKRRQILEHTIAGTLAGHVVKTEVPAEEVDDSDEDPTE